jgi:hypothetical protein
MNVARNEIHLVELVNSFSQSLGQEGATKTLKAAIAESGLEERDTYSHAEVLMICQVLTTRPGLIGILGRCLLNGFKQERPIPFVQER